MKQASKEGKVRAKAFVDALEALCHDHAVGVEPDIAGEMLVIVVYPLTPMGRAGAVGEVLVSETILEITP